MTPSARDAEVAALRRPFRIGAIAVLAFIIAVGGIVAAFGSNADRPAGIAERWLVALSDTTRDGLADDARERMEEHEDQLHPDRPFAGVADLQDDRGAADDGEARFDSVRVGRLVDGSPEGWSLVPVEVTPYEGDDPVDAYVLMVDGPEGWKVTDFVSTDLVTEDDVPVCTDGDCPGFPIDRPERAPIGFWIATLALGVLIAAGCSAAVRAATPTAVAS